MKPKIIIILVSLIFFIVLTLIGVLFINNPNIDKSLENEDLQVEALINIYQDALNIINTDNSSVILTESALKNILTNESFKESNTLRLKNIEKITENSQYNYILSIQYSKTSHILTVDIVESKVGHSKTTQKYKIGIKNGKIDFNRSGQATTIVE